MSLLLQVNKMLKLDKRIVLSNEYLKKQFSSPTPLTDFVYSKIVLAEIIQGNELLMNGTKKLIKGLKTNELNNQQGALHSVN
jgi:hypothetical protein